jgi:hypothetical integral membrane protein (TIGR02206 family)
MEELFANKDKSVFLKRFMIIFFTCALITLMIIDFITFQNFKADTRITMHNPVAGATYPLHFKTMGFAWDRDSIAHGDDIRVEVFTTRVSDGKIIPFTATRSSSRIKGKVILYLACYSCPVDLPEIKGAERWTIFARMTTGNGSSFETAPREINIDPTARSSVFGFLSVEHIVPLFSVVLVGAFIVFLFGKNRNRALRPFAGFFLIFVLWINEYLYHLYWPAAGGWTPSNSIMLHMCGLSILVMPFAFFTKSEKLRQYLTEIVYFWGFGGAVQALLTPDIGVHGFPEFKYFSFMISHCFIILNALFLVSAYNIRIRFMSFVRVVIITNICVGLCFIINPLLMLIPPFESANFFAISYPPPDGSIIDLFVLLFGPSPMYLIGLELMGLVVFGLLCLPFYLPRHSAAAAPDI